MQIESLQSKLDIRNEEISKYSKQFHNDLIELKKIYVKDQLGTDFGLDKEIYILEKNFLKDKAPENYQQFIVELRNLYESKLTDYKNEFKSQKKNNEDMNSEI